jgi:hypothetical protein
LVALLALTALIALIAHVLLVAPMMHRFVEDGRQLAQRHRPQKKGLARS